MDYKISDLITDYPHKPRKFLVNKVRYLQKHFSINDIIKLLNNEIISDEKLFDQIFFNKICREYDVVEHIVNNKLCFSTKQLEWISQTKFIQNFESERSLFLKSYGLENIKQKRPSINKLAKKVRLEKISINNNEIFRTMKIGVDYNSMDKESQKWLDIYLEEYEKAKVKLYEDLYTLFVNNPIKLLMIAAKPNYAKNHNNINETLYLSNGKRSKFRINNDLDFDVVKISYQDKNNEEYIAYINGKNNLPIKLTKDKESEVFSISKFDAQNLANNLSSKYFTLKLKGGKDTDSFYNGIKFSNFSINIKSTIIAEALRTKIAQTVCSFLDKYYKAISEVEKIHKQNSKIFETNNQFSDLSNIFEYPINLPKTEIEDVYKYNSFVTSYNQHINEFVWQVSNDRDIKNKIRKLNIIKGVPSFPLVERETVKDYEKILEDIIKTFENLRNNYQQLEWNKVDKEKLSNWLTRKSSKSGRLITAAFRVIKEKKHLSEIEYKQVLIPKEESIEVIKYLIEYIIQRINKIGNIDFKDHSKVRDFADMYAQYISLVSELVYDKNTKKYTDFRIKFNTDIALLKSSPFEGRKPIKNEIYFTGFSSKSNALKKRICFSFQRN